jgi:hypothetical protein
MSATMAKKRAAKPKSVPDPVTVTAGWVGGYRQEDALHGSQVLSIATGDDSDRNEDVYWVRLVRDGKRFTGVRLTKFGTSTSYFVTYRGSAFVACDCSDATHRPDRPGGCKHRAGLNQLRK